MNDGWIQLHRQLLESQVFANPIALKIWIWCLLKASRKERYVSLQTGKGNVTVKILPGQFIFGRYKAEEELNINGSTIYRWIQKFQSTELGMITINSNTQYSIITVCKWGDYQATKSNTEQLTSSQRAANEQPTSTDKTVKTVKTVNNSNRGTFIPPLLSEFKNYFVENGFSIELAERAFKGYEEANWHDTKGNSIKNWKQKCQNVWFKPENKTQNINMNQQQSVKIHTPSAWIS